MPAVLREHSAHRIDTPDKTIRTHPVTPVGADEVHNYRCGRSVKVGPGRGDNRWWLFRFPGPLPEPGVHLSMHRALHGIRQAAMLGSASRSGQGEGMMLPR